MLDGKIMLFAFLGNTNQTNTIISDILSANFDAEISYFNFEEILETYSDDRSTHPALIIFDLDTYSGIGKAPSNIRKLSQKFSKTPVLVIHSYELNKLKQPLIKAGAKGLISTTPSEQRLIQSVQYLLDEKEFYP